VNAGDPSYTPTATATSGLSVTITLDSSSTGCTLSGGSVTFTAAGTCVIDANQAGNGTWLAATQVQQTITVNKAPQTVGFTSTKPTPAVNAGDPSYTPTATATSGLSVTITLDSSSTGCTLSSGIVSFPADATNGSCVIDANQAGNGTWLAATQVQQTIAVFPVAEISVNPAAVEVGPGQYNWGGNLTAQGLSPGSTIYDCQSGSPCNGAGVTADPSGSASTPALFACGVGEESFPLYFDGTAADGKTIDSTTVESSPCPSP
jgi:hypothetical protein